MDYLVESLLLPNAKIKEGYHAVIVETRDGEEYTGTLARETQEEIFLRNATGREASVAKSTLARREIGQLSLMPAGLIEPLSERDRLDLLAFLGRLGKPGEFDASQGGVARRWRLANVVHTDQQNDQGGMVGGRHTAGSWGRGECGVARGTPDGGDQAGSAPTAGGAPFRPPERAG